MANFFFFTDPTLLDAQLPSQAFGPAGTSASKDLFRITDVHTSTSTDVPAFAICDGLVCGQVDAGGTLSLILKPIEQPPFDFPFISYIIYKGIDPNSLLTNGNAGPGGMIDTSKANDNKLVDRVQKTWAANDNSGDPTRECLGLHLTPASTAADYPEVDLSKYAVTEPLNNLFYQGDENFQLPLVRGGWPIGSFSAASFGLEVIVERLAYRPKIAVARKLDNGIEVTSLAPTVIAAPNDPTYFMHWHAKEECLNFIDPCAFWGSFFAANLRVKSSTGTGFERKTGNEIYEEVLRGAHDDTTATAGNFFNRNRGYIDIRNEHGHSINYYKTDGPAIQLTMDPAADIDASVVDYYGSGWPSFWVGNPNLPASANSDQAIVRFALPKTENTRPLIYVSTGYVEKLERPKDGQRFIESPRRADQPFLEEAAIVTPLIDNSGTAKIVAHYQKLHCFKRPLIVDGAAAQSSDLNTLAPTHKIGRDYFFPVPMLDELPVGSQTQFKTYDDLFYLDAATQFGRGFVARLAVGRDGDNVVLVMVPVAHVPSLAAATQSSVPTRFSSYAKLSSSQDIARYVLSKFSAQYSRVTFPDPDKSNAVVDAIRGSAKSALDDAAILVVGANVFAATVQSMAGAIAQELPMMFLEFEKNIAEESRFHSKFKLITTYLTAGSQVGRTSLTTSLEGYADDRLYS
jgi:hypothetical protein